jgi:hypothetical protein
MALKLTSRWFLKTEIITIKKKNSTFRSCLFLFIFCLPSVGIFHARGCREEWNVGKNDFQVLAQ